MPAFWWLYNMYALARNTWKFQNRDKRQMKVQNIEFDSLAPDTVEEILKACKLLEIWTAKASLRGKNKLNENVSENELIQIGKKLLIGKEAEVSSLEILGENMAWLLKQIG